MENLENRLVSKLEVAKECMEFFHGDPKETLEEITQSFLDMNALKERLDILRSVKISFFKKFTFSMPHFLQNSHFQNLIFHKIHNSMSNFSQNSHFSNLKFLVISG